MSSTTRCSAVRSPKCTWEYMLEVSHHNKRVYTQVTFVCIQCKSDFKPPTLTTDKNSWFGVFTCSDIGSLDFGLSDGLSDKQTHPKSTDIKGKSDIMCHLKLFHVQALKQADSRYSPLSQH